MCGRYTLTSQDGLVEAFGLAAPAPAEPGAWWRPRFNIAPTQPAPVVVERDGVRTLEWMRWGLVPRWADAPEVGARMINARGETLAERPAFRDAVRRRRCVVPADGFFEWRRLPATAGRSRKAPMYVHPRPRRPVALAGLWDRWRRPDGGWLTTFAIVTGPPSALVAPLHDRMPVVVPPARLAAWLGPGELPPGLLAELLAHPAGEGWVAEEVSPRVNAPAHDEPACIEPVEDAPRADAPGAPDAGRDEASAPPAGAQLRLL